jgi:hypothetical protein
MENGPFMDEFPTKTTIYKGFSMAMLNNQMVVVLKKTNNRRNLVDWIVGSGLTKSGEIQDL